MAETGSSSAASSPSRSGPEKFILSSLQHSNSKQTDFSFGFMGSSEAPLPPPPPCLQVFPSESEVTTSASSNMELVNVNGEITLLKGRVSTFDVFGVSNSDLLPGKYEGGLKLWEGSLDLVKTLYSEIRDGHLTVAGKKVLELGCGHGLPGIFACIEGAKVVHFQDFNAEVLKFLTIPNVNANISEEAGQKPDVVCSKPQMSKPRDLRFFAGDWSEIGQLLLPEHKTFPDSETRKDFLYDGYDVIVMAETVYSVPSLHNLYNLIKKCLRYPDGVVYLAAKKHYFGVGGGTAHFRLVVEEDGVMRASLLEQVADGASNVREVWKFSFSKS